MSDCPPPSANPSRPCPDCGYPVCGEILADAPNCPHGWIPLKDKTIADIKAIFAIDPELSIDPESTP